MNALKNLSLILLLSLAFTGCHNKSSKINDFNLLLYAPEYASGFDIKGAGGKESVLITVRNPWQGADSVTTWLFIVRNGEEVPEVCRTGTQRRRQTHRGDVFHSYRHA